METISNSTEFEAATTRLKQASEAYYNEGNSTLSDEEFDTLLAQVNAYDAGSAAALNTVGHGVSAGNVTHTSPMLSLAKAKDADLETWLDTHAGETFVVEPKYDGLAMALRYRNGKLVQAVMRGDGHAGKDATAALASIINIPTEIDWSESDVEVRGEVIMTHDAFDLLDTARQDEAEANLRKRESSAGRPEPTNERVADERAARALANPRNAAAGIVAAGRTKPGALTFVAYGALGIETITYGRLISTLHGLGFATPRAYYEAATGHPLPLEDVRDVINAIEAARETVNFDIDGAVVKLNSIQAQQQAGTGSRTPNWAVAYKYAPLRARSVITGLEAAIGATGQLGLRFKFHKVRVAGSQVEYATAHNPSWIAEHDIRIGDTVEVLKRGDIIPRVENPDLAKRPADAEPITVSEFCPDCAAELDRSSELWRCLTPECSLAGSLIYGTSRDAGLDIQGLGAAIVERLIDAGALSSIADLFDTLTVEQIAATETGRTAKDGSAILTGPTVAANIMAEIDRAKDAPLNRVITALAIRKVGRTMGRRLAAHFGTLQAFAAASEAELALVEGIGQKKAAIVFDGLTRAQETIARLIAAGVNAGSPVDTREEADAAAALTDQVVCVTGSMKSEPTLASLGRTQVQELIEKHGGKSTGSVSPKTTLLVCGEEGSSKWVKATAAGIRIVTPTEFAQMLAA